MALDLSVSQITRFGYISYYRQAKFFKDDEVVFGKQTFPLNMVSFKSWAQYYIVNISYLLDRKSYKLVQKHVYHILYNFTFTPSKVYD